jgi:hypothetical protein
MVNMKLSPAEAKSMLGGCCAPTEADAPKYPYGLSISLNDDTLKKLGITELPNVGAKMKLVAVVEVCSTSQYAEQDGVDKNVSLQITDMELDTGAKPATAMYPNSTMT